MRILFLLTESPAPADNGTRIISYNRLRLLSRAGFNCAMAIIGSTSTEDKIALADFCRQEHIEFLGEFPLPQRNRIGLAIVSLLTFTPYFVNRYYSKNLDGALQKLIQSWQPDTLHYDTISLAKYSRTPHTGAHLVAGAHDSYTLTLDNEFKKRHLTLFRKLYKYYQYFVVKRFERSVYSRFDAIHLMSHADANALEAIGVKSKLMTIPNGVSHHIQPTNIALNPRHLLFVAKLADDNLSALNQFVQHAWPSIKAANPGIMLKVVGRITPASELLKQQLNDPQIQFIGFVADLNTAYTLGQVALVPINKNCGIINKAVEAMAAGLVVVGFEACFTALTEASNGEHYLAGRTFAELAQHVNTILMDANKAQKIGTAASAIASQYYSWETRSDAFAALYTPTVQPVPALAAL
jgi:polysaccharide biosynthesis protein PslH